MTIVRRGSDLVDSLAMMLAIVLSLALSVALLSDCAGAQGGTTMAHHVVVDSAVRATLAAEWDTANAAQVERAYCVAWVARQQWGIPVYAVLAVMPARTDSAAPSRIWYRCPSVRIGNMGGVTVLHTHPPTTCQAGHLAGTRPSECRRGGSDAYQCEPSGIDVLTLIRSGQPYALIQCDQYALVPYYAEQLRP